MSSLVRGDSTRAGHRYPHGPYEKARPSPIACKLRANVCCSVWNLCFKSDLAKGYTLFQMRLENLKTGNRTLASRLG
jgi:hypothetical protein